MTKTVRWTISIWPKRISSNVYCAQTSCNASGESEWSCKSLLSACVSTESNCRHFSYIFASMNLENSTNLSCIKILIRLARTSKAVAEKIAAHDDLMRSIIEQYTRVPQITDGKTMAFRKRFMSHVTMNNQFIALFYSRHHSTPERHQSDLIEIVPSALCIRWRCIDRSTTNTWTVYDIEELCVRTRELHHNRNGQTANWSDAMHENNHYQHQIRFTLRVRTIFPFSLLFISKWFITQVSANVLWLDQGVSDSDRPHNHLIHSTSLRQHRSLFDHSKANQFYENEKDRDNCGLTLGNVSK